MQIRASGYSFRAAARNFPAEIPLDAFRQPTLPPASRRQPARHVQPPTGSRGARWGLAQVPAARVARQPTQQAGTPPAESAAAGRGPHRAPITFGRLMLAAVFGRLRAGRSVCVLSGTGDESTHTEHPAPAAVAGHGHRAHVRRAALGISHSALRAVSAAQSAGGARISSRHLVAAARLVTVAQPGRAGVRARVRALGRVHHLRSLRPVVAGAWFIAGIARNPAAPGVCSLRSFAAPPLARRQVPNSLALAKFDKPAYKDTSDAEPFS
jgi:hypothetical protein